MPKTHPSHFNTKYSSSPYARTTMDTSLPPRPVTGVAGHERASVAWSAEDDAMLIEFRAKGYNWTQISTNFHQKTSNACRKRHERLMEKKNSENYDTIKTEDLANAYMEVREEMWKLLAQKLGEPKWHIIETKCMEKGLKNLQTAHRSRKNSRATHPSSPNSHHSNEAPFNDDSGVEFATEQPGNGQINPYMQNTGFTGYQHQAPVSYPNYNNSSIYAPSPSQYTTSMPPPMSMATTQTLPLPPPLSQSQSHSYTPTHLQTHLPPMFNNHNNFQTRNQMISSSYA